MQRMQARPILMRHDSKPSTPSRSARLPAPLKSPTKASLRGRGTG
ncbi:hypothetical protein SynROS8604_01137 [Synechococcus sp. ROS8604]|nr:hypothetical protein SynROS8604_01137 [Synechococcus sp. ROS8604]